MWIFLFPLLIGICNGFQSTYVRVGVSFYGGYGYGTTSDIDYEGHRLVVGEPGRDNSTGYIHVYDWDVITGKYHKTAIVTGDADRDRIGKRLAMSEDGKYFATITDKGVNSVLNIYEQVNSQTDPPTPAMDALPPHMNYTQWDKITNDTIVTGEVELAMVSTLLVAGTKLYNYTNGDWVVLGTELPRAIFSNRCFSKDGKSFILREYIDEEAYLSIYKLDSLGSLVQVGTTQTGANGTGWGDNMAISDDGSTFVVSAPESKPGEDDDLIGYLEVYEYNGLDWVTKGDIINGTKVGGIGMGTLSITAGGNSVLANDGTDIKIFSWIDTAAPTVAPSNAPTASPTTGIASRPTKPMNNNPTQEWFLFNPNSIISGNDGQIAGSGFAVITTNVNLSLMRVYANIFAPEITDAPTTGPTTAPTGSPTGNPTVTPTGSPIPFPTESPTTRPTKSPTVAPTPESERANAQRAAGIFFGVMIGVIVIMMAGIWKLRQVSYNRVLNINVI